MTLKPEHEQEFLELARATMAKVHASELGTLLYVLTNHPTEAHTYVWIERYRDAAALEAHMQSPHLAEAMPKLGDWLSAPPQALMLGQVLPK